MTLCQLIKLVLDEQYEEIESEGRDEAIKEQLRILGERYAHLKSDRYDGIDYSSPVSRFAYIQRYTVAHGDYIRQVIQGSAELRGVFEGKDVQVACLGGGPGSDFLGILKYMNRAGKKCPLTCYLFDKERAWSDSWSDVARLLERDFQFYPSFAQMDAADPKTYRSYHRIKKCDLMTLSYFMSEMWKYRRDVEPFFEHCFGAAKKGALVLYIDNQDQEFRGWFDTLAAKHGLEILKACSGDLAFEIAEEKTDLGEYFDKFGWPKRKGTVDIRIARKR